MNLETVALIILLVIIADGFFWVKTNHHAFVAFMQKKYPRVYPEGGPYYSFPGVSLFGKIWQFSEDLITLVMEGEGITAIVVTTLDKLKLLIEGSLQYKNDQKNLHTRSKVKKGTIEKGLRDTVEEALGELAGQEKGEDFRKRREEIRLLANSVLRLERRIDYYINKGNPIEFKTHPTQAYLEYVKRLVKENKYNPDLVEKIKDKLDPMKWEIPTIKSTVYPGEEDLLVLEFYRRNVSRCEFMLELETTMQDQSPIEKKYGIDIAAFALAKVLYTKKTEESLEKEAQAEHDLEAWKHRQTAQLAFMDKLIERNVDPGKASDDAQAAVGIAEKQIISGPAIPWVNATKP